MSIITPIAVYLATHPAAELTTEQIHEMWGVKRVNIHKSLSYAELKGWVKSELRPNPKGKTKKIRFYSAGVRIEKEAAR
jgi:hypothetical protein